MTRNRELSLKDLTGCDHTPETAISRDGVVVAWICRCGATTHTPGPPPPAGFRQTSRGELVLPEEARVAIVRLREARLTDGAPDYTRALEDWIKSVEERLAALKERS